MAAKLRAAMAERTLGMKRDMDLIRDILLSFDETQAARVNKKNLQIEGYTQEQIDFHIEIMEEAGLLYHEIVRPTRDGHVVGGMRIDMGIRPTMAGYDFAHSVRDNEVWKETKKGAKSAGGFTLDLLRDLAKGFIKTKIEEHTGVKL